MSEEKLLGGIVSLEICAGKSVSSGRRPSGVA